MNNLIGGIVMGVVRHALTTVAGGFVAKGLLTGDQSTTAVSALVTLIGIGLSVYSKLQAADKLASASAPNT